jgi:hypothetical protein
MRVAFLLAVLASGALVTACGGATASPGPAGDASASEASLHEASVPDVGTDVVTMDAGADAALDAGPDVIPFPDAAGTPVSQDPSDMSESEDQIAVAPDGTIGILWSAYSQTGDLEMPYRFSTDDGASFSPIERITVPAGYEPGDPSITTDAQGNFYLSTLGIHQTAGNIDQVRVYVAKAPKGSTTFGTPVEVTDPAATHFCDHPKIRVLASGAIVVSYMDSTDLAGTTSYGVLASSPDGTTWTRSTIVTQPDAVFSNLFWTCEGQGVLYATYLEYTATTGYVALRTSTDQGATWSHPSTVVSLPSEMPAANDPICVANGADVWIQYTTTPMPATSSNSLDPAYAMPIAHSGNGGMTLDATRMNSLDTTASAEALLPVLLRETSGTLDVAYLAGQADMDPMGSVRLTRATGSTFAPSTMIAGPLSFDVDRTTSVWLGDYFGAVLHGPAMYVAYPINSTGIDHIYFRKVPLP